MTFGVLDGPMDPWFIQAHQAYASVLSSSLGKLVREEPMMFSAILEILSAFWHFYKNVFCKG